MKNLDISPFSSQSLAESFQDYSWIQDFETGFPYNVSLKILNLADHDSLSDLFSAYLKTIGHLNFKVFGVDTLGVSMALHNISRTCMQILAKFWWT